MASSNASVFRPPPGLSEPPCQGARSTPEDRGIPGSLGHPLMCGKLCVHIARGGTCSSGMACGFCHGSHDRQAAKLDKEQRRMIQEMSQQDLTSLVIPHISRKMAQAGFHDQASTLVSMLAGQAHEETVSASIFCARSMKKLDRTLARLPLLALVGYCHNSFSEQVQHYVLELRREVHLQWLLSQGAEVPL
mmetsp:Transcript_23598/g.44573  ORF Transcript_23598/g.44573 Transcript_23598/m.44573 type:complete len:191 (-) Transcript_23598:41-613(-)